MKPLMDELTFRSYAHQRTMFPDVQPERWAAIFQNVPAMEERFLKTFIAKVMEAAKEIEVADGSGLTNSGITQGNTGVSSASERKPSGEDSGCQVRFLDAHQAADSASLPVPLGREVSGIADGREDQEIRPDRYGAKRVEAAALPSVNKASENQASPADQIFSYFPLAEIVEKVFKQRSFLCN